MMLHNKLAAVVHQFDMILIACETAIIRVSARVRLNWLISPVDGHYWLLSQAIA